MRESYISTLMRGRFFQKAYSAIQSIPKGSRCGTVALVMAMLAGTFLTGCHTMKKEHAAGPRKVLVVTVTKGFRHSSIPTAEKVLAELGTKTGIFTVDYARVEPTDAQFKNADGKTDTNKVDAAIRQVLAEKMSAAALANYDAVIFANTTGDLPLPDEQAFLDWIKSGKAFVGIHS